MDPVAAFTAEPWRLQPYTFAQHVSGGKWHPYPYLRFLSDACYDAITGGGGRLIFNMPPGHGKSSFASLWVPTWFLENLPSRKVIMTSHGSELAQQWGRDVRNTFVSNPILRTRLREDSTAADRWNTRQGGGMLSAGVATGITGFRGDLVLIDDPHPTWEAVQSPTHRRRVREWFDGTLLDRCEPNATIILLMHRWHPDDLTGHLIEKGGWKVIRLPALAEPNDPMGRQPGEPLCPERYSADALRAMMTAAGPIVAAAKFQQKPELYGAGKAYAAFAPDKHYDRSLKPRLDLPLCLAWDFNINPGSHCIAGQYDSRLDLFAAVREFYGPRWKTRQILETVVQWIGATKYPEIWVYGDRAGNTPNTITTDTDYLVIERMLRATGAVVKLRVPAANPPVKSRMDSMNDALCDAAGAVHFKVNPDACPRLVNDLKNVDQDENGLIDKSDPDLSHPSDAFGYFVHWMRPTRRPAVKRKPAPVILGNTQ